MAEKAAKTTDKEGKSTKRSSSVDFKLSKRSKHVQVLEFVRKFNGTKGADGKNRAASAGSTVNTLLGAVLVSASESTLKGLVEDLQKADNISGAAVVDSVLQARTAQQTKGAPTDEEEQRKMLLALKAANPDLFAQVAGK